MPNSTIKKFTWPDKSRISKGAFGIVKKLRSHGFETYIAGGAVRDALLGRPIREIDIATSAKPAQVKKIFKKTIPTGEKHGTVTVFPPHPPLSRQGRGIKGEGYEVTTFRKEGIYLDARRPSRVAYVKDAAIDAKRRDFTINAVFFDPVAGRLLDFASGLADIRKKVIRAVGRADDRFAEDALRMMRAVRLAVQLGFRIEPATMRNIRKHNKKIKKISAERIKQELDKALDSRHPAEAIRILDATRLLEQILPEVVDMKKAAQPKNHHSEGNVYKHTLLALTKTDASFDLATRYGVLFHDIGKGSARRIIGGKARFFNHQNIGADITRRICGRLKFSAAETDKIVWLVRYHMVPFDLPKMKLATRRKWAQERYFSELLRLFLADIRASIPAGGAAVVNPAQYAMGRKLLGELARKPALKKPLISGNDVKKTLSVNAGPLVGAVLKKIDEKKLSGELKSKKDALDFLKRNKNNFLNFPLEKKM